MPDFEIKILESNRKIEGLINQALRKELDRKIVRASNSLIAPVRSLVREAIMAQPEYTELDNGALAAHFGLPDGRVRIDHIINLWTKNIVVRTKRAKIVNKKVAASIEIGIVRADYADVLSEDVATVTTEKGQPLPWLEWLLTFGDTVIVRNFDIKFNPIGRSRSGLAIMVSEPEGRWGVPPQYAGTPTNNFVTRALSSVSDDLRNIIINKIKTTV